MAKARRTRARLQADDTVITIRTMVPLTRTISETVRRSPDIERLSDEWTYTLRSRARWLDDPLLRESISERALADLERLGISRAFMKKLATVSHVEVELHAWDPADLAVNQIHEKAAAMPWEYLLSAGTRGVGRYRTMLVTRLLRNGSPAVIPAPPREMLFVESAPGRLRDAYDFESERERIRAAIGADGQDGDRAAVPAMRISATESLTQLRKTVRERRWEAMHVTGLDTHQAAWYIETLYEDLEEKVKKQPSAWRNVVDSFGRVRDGMVLREPNVAELPVDYATLASVLINPKEPPRLVTLNLYYSGARTARELVARGARAAIGFLDEIDDEAAERFFQAFYWAWCRPGGALAIPHAFVEAWQKMTSVQLHGTAIVIWMGRSVFDSYEVSARPEPLETESSDDRTAWLARLDTTPMRELLQVQLEVPTEVNYSLLHNDRPLLSRLTLTKLIKEPLEDITVQVELNLGGENYPYRCTHLILDEPQLAMAPLVRIPLTATLPRSLRERVHSTVYVKVACRGRTAWETTERVTLIPVDEWVDDTDNNPWLPSFVLPRDPAILELMTAARRYLVGITDNPAAGFDGYQSVDDSASDPTAGVDAQVRAIWTVLVNEYRLQYINPPPAYSEQSQRLRTPSDILGSKSGTCIDLALLLASCLEYIDIYPVIVLLTGHAFVGYWRSDVVHDSFVEVVHIPAEVPPVGSQLVRSAGARLVEQYGWRLTRLHYDEIMEYVTSGDLVMLEATLLTSASSFAEGVEEGRANMRSRREFDSLLDIRLARSSSPPVTPLPIINHQ